VSGHALLAPSAAHRWMRCPGSVAMESGRPDSSSEYADEGTVAHEVAARCLSGNVDAASHIGWQITLNGRTFTVDADMAAHVQRYVDAVRDYAAGGELMVEQRVEFSRYVDVPDQKGTSDAVIIQDDGDELQVHDLKYGRGVKVDAEDNEQLMLYALGALDLVEPLGYEPERVRLVIHQPRLDHLSEWDCTVEELRAFAERARTAAQEAIGCLQLGVDEAEDLSPGEKQCRFCKAKATCGALRDAVLEPVLGSAPPSPDEFELVNVPGRKHIDPTTPAWLAASMNKVALIEDWCKAVRAEVERRLLAGLPIAGWKVVEGRRGNRAWKSVDEAEAALKSMRLKHDQMYDYSVISPTSAEKLAKADALGERQWKKLQTLITQADGKPSVAPESDKRPALVITPTADEFEAVTTPAAAETADDLV
jgi:hypothetical protein